MSPFPSFAYYTPCKHNAVLLDGPRYRSDRMSCIRIILVESSVIVVLCWCCVDVGALPHRLRLPAFTRWTLRSRAHAFVHPYFLPRMHLNLQRAFSGFGTACSTCHLHWTWIAIVDIDLSWTSRTITATQHDVPISLCTYLTVPPVRPR